MRSAVLSIACFAMLKICGGEAPTPPVGAATSAFVVTAQHGGVMVAADDAWIELVTKQSGEVEAYVVDTRGQPMPETSAQVTSVQVQGQDGLAHDVALRWDPAERRYAGYVEVQPIQAPAQVQVVVRGQPRRAVAPQVVLWQQPPGTIVVGAPQRPQVVVQAPQRPQVVVQAPQPSIVVQAPQPPSIVVQAPQRPQVVVQAPQPSIVVQAPQPPRGTIVLQAPQPPVVFAPPRPGVVVVGPDPRPGVIVAAPRPGVVVVDGDDDDDGRRGRGHAYGRRGREGGASVVVSPPRPGVVVVAPPRPGAVVVGGGGGGGGRVVVGGGGRGRGQGRGGGRGD